MTTEVVDILEDAQTLVEDTAEYVEASWITSNPRTLIPLAVLVGAVLGGALTYLVVSKRISEKAQTQANIQIEDVKAHYARNDKPSLKALASRYVDPEAVADTETIMSREGYVAYDKIPPTNPAPETPITTLAASKTVVTESAEVVEIAQRNIFESEAEDTYFVFDVEFRRREEFPDQPHVITQDEFNDNETDAEQISLIYYDGDGTLVDDKQSPLPDIDMIMGVENVLRFGHGSGDPSIVYIRNPRLGVDFEVTNSDGKFAKEVLGFDDGELQHSHHRRQRRMRPSDE